MPVPARLMPPAGGLHRDQDRSHWVRGTLTQEVRPGGRTRQRARSVRSGPSDVRASVVAAQPLDAAGVGLGLVEELAPVAGLPDGLAWAGAGVPVLAGEADADADVEGLASALGAT